MTLNLDDANQIALEREELELAHARATILMKICRENAIDPDEALIAVAVFVGRILRDYYTPDYAGRILAALENLTIRTTKLPRGPDG